MKNTVISVEHLTKQYDLGVIGTGTLSRDLERWWARTRGKPDPYAIIGRSQKPSECLHGMKKLFTLRMGYSPYLLSL